MALLPCAAGKACWDASGSGLTSYCVRETDVVVSSTLCDLVDLTTCGSYMGCSSLPLTAVSGKPSRSLQSRWSLTMVVLVTV